jgi:cytochrome c553
MKNSILLAVLVSVALTSGVSVYAETATVEVPFNSHGQTCNFDEIAVEFHCVWQGFKEVYTIEDLKEYKELLTAERYDQEIQKLNEQALAEIAIEQAKLTPNEKTIQKIEEKLAKGIATATDSVYMNLLKELNTCKQGMDRQTAPFQEAREFEISEFNLWQVNNVPVEGHLGQLVMAVEECRAQIALKKVVGEGYSNMPTGDDDVQFSLLVEYEGQRALNFEDHTATHRNIDRSLICGNNQFPLTHQAQFGCEVLYDGKTVEQIEAENNARFGTDGVIHYESELLTEFHAFMESYGNKIATVEDKVNAEKLAEPIAKEMIENNNFVQHQLRNDLQ